MPLSKIDSDSLNSPITAVNLAYTGTLTGGTGIVNLGSGQVYKDASGNVGIGTSSPATNLQVTNISATTNATVTPVTVQAMTSGTAANGFGSSVEFNAEASDGASYAQTTISSIWTDATAATRSSALTFATRTSAGAITERARIDSSGRLLVGTTTGSPDSFGEKLFVSQSDITSAFVAANANASCTTSAIIGVTADRNTTNNSFYAISYYNRGATAYKFRVADSGNVTNTNNSYGAISDIKLKENIVDATPKLDKLNQVRIVNYNLIGEEQKQLGVIAQELEQLFPSMIDESPDRDAEGNDLGTTTKSVKYSVFVPMLIKATQELKAIVDGQAVLIAAQGAEIAALKGTP